MLDLILNTADDVGLANVLALRADEAEGDQAIELRDHTNNAFVAAAGETTTYNVVNLSANEANTISIAHSGSTTLAAPAAANNALTDNFVDLDVADGVTAVNLTITNGVNSDNRFNFQLYTDSDRALNSTGVTSAFSTAQDAGTTNAVTSLTLTDSDNESNTVLLAADGYLAGAAQGNGTAYTSVTLAGGTSGTFMNLDATANAFGFDTTGASTGDTNVVTDIVAGAAERLSAATINASAMSSNVVVRVGNNFNSATGAQSITMGSGDDTVIFDMLADTRAGLTISDTVAGGTGSDTLAIDGNGVAISLGASEWTNVTGMETIRLISNGVASNNALLATNAYNLTLTDLLVDNNGANGSMIAIINDNDDSTTAAGSANVGATIDARALAANNAFSYNGQETSATAGTVMTADRFVFADVNINGTSVIDGGADQTTASVVVGTQTSGTTAGHSANIDILEVRNAAVVSAGDLANITNVGVISFTNDTATAVSSTLELNNAIVDALVNSTAAADGTSAATIAATHEILTINAVDNALVAGATTGLNMQTAGLTNAALSLNVTGGGAADVLSGGAGVDVLNGGAGNDTISSGDGNDTITGGTGADVLTGGAGVDTFVFTPGDNATPSTTVFDTITDYRLGGDSVIDFAAALAVGTQTNAAAAGVATVGAAGFLTFNAADTTFAQHLIAAEAALSGGAANRAVVWQEGADSYMFVTDAVAGVGANDVLIQLTGVTSTATGFTFAGGNITAIG
ncbi:beta strand repeat-containing protein [Thiothrix unzii]|uniref:Calcium-binding protein n=1 Tax=Thiothrix unzii TaxID=111769 RepID=A0A975IGB1_9GAMM|nr:calcium-binding protein [Thiothrix unzii]QTR52597.1 calcium-binding protein [Thiothrix unzii]